MLEELYAWFVEFGYHGEIIDDPSLSNPNRRTLYMHKGISFSWKIYDDSSIPIYLGISYMTSWVVNEILFVTSKVGEVYGRTESYPSS